MNISVPSGIFRTIPPIRQPMRHSVRFGKKGEEAPSARSGKLRWYQKVYNGMISLYPISNLLGGLCIFVSGILPGGDPKAPQQPTPVVQSVHDATTIAQVSDNPKAMLQAFKTVLSGLGWKVFVPMAFISSGMTGLSNGFLKKQPSIVLSNVIYLGLAPAFMVEPTVPLRAAVVMTVGMFAAGFANTLNNQYQNKKGAPPREFDMAPLISLKALKQLVGQDNPSTIALAKRWMGKAIQGLQFVVVDHMLMLKRTVQVASYPVLHPKSFAQSAKTFWHEAKAMAKPDAQGNRANLAAILQPNGTVNQVGAFLAYMGSVPMMIFTGPESAVVDIGSKLISAGILTMNTSLFAVGLDRHKDAIGKALLIGIPLKAVGDAFLQTDMGYGASMMGVSGIAAYLAEQSKLQPTPAVTEPVQDKKGTDTR